MNTIRVWPAVQRNHVGGAQRVLGQGRLELLSEAVVFDVAPQDETGTRGFGKVHELAGRSQGRIADKLRQLFRIERRVGGAYRNGGKRLRRRVFGRRLVRPNRVVKRHALSRQSHVLGRVRRGGLHRQVGTGFVQLLKGGAKGFPAHSVFRADKVRLWHGHVGALVHQPAQQVAARHEAVVPQPVVAGRLPWVGRAHDALRLPHALPHVVAETHFLRPPGGRLGVDVVDAHAVGGERRQARAHPRVHSPCVQRKRFAVQQHVFVSFGGDEHDPGVCKTLLARPHAESGEALVGLERHGAEHFHGHVRSQHELRSLHQRRSPLRPRRGAGAHGVQQRQHLARQVFAVSGTVHPRPSVKVVGCFALPLVENRIGLVRNKVGHHLRRLYGDVRHGERFFGRRMIRLRRFPKHVNHLGCHLFKLQLVDAPPACGAHQRVGEKRFVFWTGCALHRKEPARHVLVEPRQVLDVHILNLRVARRQAARLDFVPNGRPLPNLVAPPLGLWAVHVERLASHELVAVGDAELDHAHVFAFLVAQSDERLSVDVEVAALHRHVATVRAHLALLVRRRPHVLVNEQDLRVRLGRDRHHLALRAHHRPIRRLGGVGPEVQQRVVALHAVVPHHVHYFNVHGAYDT